MKIDLVYLWVDGNDPQWRARRAEATGIPDDGRTGSGSDNCDGRYANSNELIFSLRSVALYAPWINRIHIVTDRQIPVGLDTSNPKIHIVDHTEILPSDVLPTYNSTVIEHALFRIPGLSEHFLYANDDMFFNRPVSPSDFFTDEGLPIARLNRRPMRRFTLWLKEKVLRKKTSMYNRTIQTASDLVRKKHGRAYGSKTHHNIDAYRRSDFEQTFHTYESNIVATFPNRLRTSDDVQRNLYTYDALARGSMIPRFVNRHTSFRLHIDNTAHYKKLDDYNPMLFCLNDSEYATAEHREIMKEYLRKRFSEKSPFEL